MNQVYPSSKLVNLHDQSVKILTTREEIELGLRRIKQCGNICYQSEGKTPVDKFVKKLIDATPHPHTSVLEHLSITAIFVTDRSTSHQLVRHRLASYSQESQRYCAYNRGKFAGKINVVAPQHFYGPNTTFKWRQKFMKGMEDDYELYADLIQDGAIPEDARSVLANSVKTEIAVSADLAEWRHIMAVRCAKNAQPQIRALMIAFYKAFSQWPYLFGDIPTSTDGICRMPEVPVIPSMLSLSQS